MGFRNSGHEDRDSLDTGAEATGVFLSVKCKVVVHILQQPMSSLLPISVFPKETRGSSLLLHVESSNRSLGALCLLELSFPSWLLP